MGKRYDFQPLDVTSGKEIIVCRNLSLETNFADIESLGTNIDIGSLGTKFRFSRVEFQLLKSDQFLVYRHILGDIEPHDHVCKIITFECF